MHGHGKTSTICEVKKMKVQNIVYSKVSFLLQRLCAYVYVPKAKASRNTLILWGV